jgi:hypothetical protein
MVWTVIRAVPSGGLGWTLLLAVLLAIAGLQLVRQRARARGIGVVLLALALVLPGSVAIAQVPFIFNNGQIADAFQVNQDFAYLDTRTYATVAQTTPLSLTGVAVATLTLPQGNYVLHAKWRYQQQAGTTTSQSVACSFYQDTVGNILVGGSNDASEAAVPPGGLRVDGSTLSWVQIIPNSPPITVVLGCYGPATVNVVAAAIVAEGVPAITGR